MQEFTSGNSKDSHDSHDSRIYRDKIRFKLLKDNPHNWQNYNYDIENIPSENLKTYMRFGLSDKLVIRQKTDVDLLRK